MLSKLLNAQTCSQSRKRIRNNSVYCLLLDQWLAINYCENMCRHYEPQETDPMGGRIPRGEVVDNSGPIVDEERQDGIVNE